VVPLLALLFYIYVEEIRDARRTGNWDAVIAGATLFGADFVNESINGWIFSISGYSALWLAPGPTALRTTVGWNVEIMFMFAIVGIIYCKSVDEDRTAKVFGLPNRWFWALFYSAVSVLVELVLNKGGSSSGTTGGGTTAPSRFCRFSFSATCGSTSRRSSLSNEGRSGPRSWCR